MPACWVCCLHSWNLSGLATRWLEREPKLIQLAWLDKSRAEEKDLPFFWQPVDEWFWNIAFTDLLEDSTWYRQWKKQNNSFEIYFTLWSIFSKTNWRHKRRKTERKKETGKSQLHALPPPPPPPRKPPIKSEKLGMGETVRITSTKYSFHWLFFVVCRERASQSAHLWSWYTSLKINNKHQTKVSAHFIFFPVCEYSVLVYPTGLDFFPTQK